MSLPVNRRVLIGGLSAAFLARPYKAEAAFQLAQGRRAQGGVSFVLAPAAIAFSPLSPPGSFVETITGFVPGETAVSISPSDGLALNNGGRILVIGQTASTPGLKGYTVTTSTGRTLTLIAACASDLTALVAANPLPVAGQALSTTITGATAGSTIAIVGNSAADLTLTGTGTTRTLTGTPSKPGRLKFVETSADGSQVRTTFPIRVAAAPVTQPSNPSAIVASNYTAGTNLAAGDTTTLPGWAVRNASTFNTTNGQAGLVSTTAGAIAVKSNASWYGDQSVTFWSTNAYALLKLSGGRAFFFGHKTTGATPNGQIQIGVISGLDETKPFLEGGGTNGSVQAMFIDTRNTLVGLFGPAGSQAVANYSPIFRAGDRFTFGIRGHDLYVDYTTGGVTTRLYTYKYAGLYNMTPGAIALAGITSLIGISAATFAPSSAVNSELQDPAALLLDVRDFGCKNLTATGIGSMAAGSNQLVLSRTNPGWAVGDDIIVEIGAEVGQTPLAYNTKGVGGIWPNQSASSFVSGSAKFTATNQTYFRIDNPSDPDDGKVFGASGGTWSKWDPNLVYYNRAIPRSLVAKVTAVSGNTLTLSKSATVAVSGAAVHSDFGPNLNAVVNQSWPSPAAISPFTPGQEFYFPPGTWNQSQLWAINSVSGGILESPRVWGAGRNATTLRSPKGCPSGVMLLTRCDNPIISSFRHVGCHGETGMMIDPGPYDVLNGMISYGQGIAARNGNDTEYYEIDLVDSPVNTLQNGYVGGNCVTERCYIERTCPDKRYINWQYEISNCTFGSFVIRDCAFYSPYLVKVWEAFSSANVSFIRPNSYNGTFAMNSNGSGMLIDSPKIRASSNCLVPAGAMGVIANALMFTADNVQGYSLIDINNNISNTSGGTNAGGVASGIIQNPDIFIEGWMGYTGVVMRAIGITGQPGWKVQGTQLSGGPKAKWKGRIRAPLPRAGCTTPGNSVQGPQINSDSNQTVVFGVLLDTYLLPGSILVLPYGLHQISISTDAASLIVNCITGLTAVSLYGGASNNFSRARSSTNISGKAYAALP